MLVITLTLAALKLNKLQQKWNQNNDVMKTKLKLNWKDKLKKNI